MVQVIARYKLADGNEDAVLRLLPQLAEATRAEPGNVSFEIYRNVAEAHDVVLLERYASQDAFAAHRASEHFKALVLEQIAPLLESRVVETYDIVAG
jgi:quinol monooxygenase YgiN